MPYGTAAANAAESMIEIAAAVKKPFGRLTPDELCEELSLMASYAGSMAEITAATESAYRKEQGAVLMDLPEGMRAYDKEITINERTADYRYWRDYAQNLAKAVGARIDALRTVISNKREELKTLRG
jgi:hypothetical protein